MIDPGPDLEIRFFQSWGIARNRSEFKKSLKSIRDNRPFRFWFCNSNVCLLGLFKSNFIVTMYINCNQ